MKEKKLFLLLALFAATLLYSNSAYAQKVRYVYKKTIDANGIESKIDYISDIWYLEFSNNKNTIVIDAKHIIANVKLWYQYDHKENGNLIYYKYRRYTDHLGNLKTECIPDNYLVASPDFSVINDVIGYTKRVDVIEQQPEPSKGNLYR